MYKHINYDELARAYANTFAEGSPTELTPQDTNNILPYFTSCWQEEGALS